MPKAATPPRGSAFLELVSVMRQLLAPGGCPWDRAQTVESLRPYLVEEMYEVLAAIDSGDAHDHCDELGDLLLQVVFQAALREDQGLFTIDDVSRAITAKMRRRHPHVFGDSSAEKPEDVEQSWAAIKSREREERGASQGVLDGVPVAMPALARAAKISSRAAQVGFDWPTVDGCREKVLEELAEVDQARSTAPAEVFGELGDLLFAVVSFARKLGVDAESALRGATTKFENRFAHIERELARRQKSPAESSLEEMDELWNQAKAASPDTSGE